MVILSIAVVMSCAAPMTSSATAVVIGSSDASSKTAPPRYVKPLVRLDFVLTSTEPDKPKTTASYTINLEEDTTGEIRLVESMPLSQLGGSRVDLQTKLKTSFSRSAQGGFLVHGDFAMNAITNTLASSSSSPPKNSNDAFHAKALKGDALVFGTTPTAIIASSEDPTTHRRDELGVSVTQLR